MKFPLAGPEPYDRMFDFVEDNPDHVPGYLPPFPGSDAHLNMMVCFIFIFTLCILIKDIRG